LSDFPARNTVHRGYDQAWFAPISDVEDRHFWFWTRNKVIATMVKQLTASMAPGYLVLEAGCGTGNVLRVLEQTCSRGLVIGMDMFPEGLHYARQRTSCPLIQGDVNAPPFAKQFDLICLFDVLEHLPDDIQVLVNLRGMLSQDGVLLLTVPAHPSLWSYFDEASHHFRRYKLHELRSKLIGAGYHVEYITHYMATVFPLVWLGRRLRSLNRRQGAPDIDGAKALASAELRIIPVVNSLLALLLSLEVRLIARRRHLLMGTSLLAVAHRESATDK
jgi:SAM-dependent methyltransferase